MLAAVLGGGSHRQKQKLPPDTVFKQNVCKAASQNKSRGQQRSKTVFAVLLLSSVGKAVKRAKIGRKQKEECSGVTEKTDVESAHIGQQQSMKDAVKHRQQVAAKSIYRYFVKKRSFAAKQRNDTVKAGKSRAKNDQSGHFDTSFLAMRRKTAEPTTPAARPMSMPVNSIPEPLPCIVAPRERPLSACWLWSLRFCNKEL